jgi:hypothetical protein
MPSDSLTPTQRRATAAFCEALTAVLLPAFRQAAAADGYAIAVHGSMSRDIDLVAVPWSNSAIPADRLVENLVSVARDLMGGACLNGDTSERPHGRRSYTIVLAGSIPWIDLSVMPTAPTGETR